MIPARDVTKPWLHGCPSSRSLEQLHALGKRAFGDDAGVSTVNHLLRRHTWATAAETYWGLFDPQIQRVMRHATPLTSKQHYRHADLEGMREYTNRVSFDPPPVAGSDRHRAVQ